MIRLSSFGKIFDEIFIINTVKYMEIPIGINTTAPAKK